MSNINKITTVYTNGETYITAALLNEFKNTINDIIDELDSSTPEPTPTPETVATPSISISDTTATISCSTSDATIYYTIDGNTPTTSSTQYTGAITLSGACTIKAIAVKSGMNNSSVASVEYNPSATVQPPTIYIRDLAIIMDAESGATIHYTTDGSTPTANSTQYTGAFTSAVNIASLKAIAVKNGSSSGVASASFTAPQTTELAEPQIVIEGNKVTILSNGVGTIRYSIDDSDSFNVYSEPFTLESPCRVRARTNSGTDYLYSVAECTTLNDIVVSVRATQIISAGRIVRANSSETNLGLAIPGSGTSYLTFYPIVQNRKYHSVITLQVASSGFWGYASEVVTSIASEGTSISGKYLADTPAPGASNPTYNLDVTAENYPYLVTCSSQSRSRRIFCEIVKEG